MPTTLLAFNLLLFLLPGFVTLKVREALAIVAKTSDFSRVVDAMLFTLLNYAVYFPLATALRFKQFTILSLRADAAGTDIQLAAPYLPALFLIPGTAIALGVIAGVGTDRDWFYRFKTGLHLTRRPARIDVWADAFYEARGKWILVQLEDGTQIIGWPFRYSDEPEHRQLFLKDARVRQPDGTEYDVNGPGLLLTEASKIKLIEFLE